MAESTNPPFPGSPQTWPTPCPDMLSAIGNTPLIRLNRASAATGCEILGKAEFMNPGGSVKDRAALAIIEAAEADGSLEPGGTIVEGTAGNTGIGLTLVANARGYRSVIVMPETQSREKIDFLRMIGADLRLVPARPFRDPGNYVHVSRRLAEETGALWANQFDNLANRDGHRRGTAEEIWRQTGGSIHAFTCACGTGGTLAGVSLGFHKLAAAAGRPVPRIVLADPEGSGLYGWVKSNDLSVVGSSVTVCLPALIRSCASPTARRSNRSSTCCSSRGFPSAARPGSMSPPPSASRAVSARDIRWRPSCATAGRATSPGCSTPNSCAARTCRCLPGCLAD